MINLPLQMKTLVTTLLLTSAVATMHLAHAQTHRCGTQGQQTHLPSHDPQSAARRMQVEQAAAAWLATHPDAGKTGSVIVIPTVVHVVYANATQNISDAQILSQMAVLNADYRRLNADTSRTRSIFKPFAADCEIEFCLAVRDPNGDTTTGITRTATTLPSFGSDYAIFHTTMGGEDAWPTDQYLNIWVCKLNSGALGFASQPGSVPPDRDGVVMDYRYFGTMGTAIAPYHKGRPCTHEIGHWLGLFHLNGGLPCEDNDLVSDTPMMDDYMVITCDTTGNTCADSPVDYPDMIENFMWYADDSCMNLFTEGQKTRMWSFLNTTRLSLLTSPGCVPPAVGVEDPTLARWNAHVAPNPSRGVFTLRFTNLEGNNWNATVTDLSGKTVWQSHDNLATEAEIDLGDAAEGIYLLQVECSGQQLQRKLQVVR